MVERFEVDALPRLIVPDTVRLLIVVVAKVEVPVTASNVVVAFPSVAKEAKRLVVVAFVATKLVEKRLVVDPEVPKKLVKYRAFADRPPVVEALPETINDAVVVVAETLSDVADVVAKDVFPVTAKLVVVAEMKLDDVANRLEEVAFVVEALTAANNVVVPLVTISFVTNRLVTVAEVPNRLVKYIADALSPPVVEAFP